MSRSDLFSRTAIRDGLVAGVLAGLVLVVLFFFYDLGQGTPLRTPAFLWGAMWQHGVLDPTIGVVMAYTVVHFIVWGALGVLACVATRWAGAPRNVLLGAAYGLFACSLVFYLGLIRAPAELVLNAPAWPAVFFGNALAGVVMFTILHWMSSEPGVIGGMNFLRTHPVTRRGLMAGAIGATVLAVWFLLMDTLVRDPFYTPAALATILFRGGGGPADVQIALGPVLGYTFVHLAAFAFVGILLSHLTEQVQRFPPLILGVGILFVVFEVFIIALAAILGDWVLSELAWWSILLGNLLAAGAMALYFAKTHPGLVNQLTDEAIWAT